jgi:HicB-like protein involved in pilus formation
MQMAPHIEALQADLAEFAALGDEATAQAAQRLGVALRSSAGLRILDALTEAALELSAQIPSGHVEVRLAGQDPALVFVEEARAEPPATPEDDQSARITLRLPESLKARLEAAAAREGVSVNTWLVRALARSVSSPPPSRRIGNRLTGYGRS